MNRFKKLRVTNLFPIQLGWKLHWFRTLHFAITSKKYIKYVLFVFIVIYLFERIEHLFSKDALNWSKKQDMSIYIFYFSISNKCCSFERSIH